MKNLVNLVALTLISSSFLFSQNHIDCDAARKINEEMKRNPAYRMIVERNMALAKEYQKYPKEAGATHIIPTVIHIMHDNLSAGSYVKKEQVLEAISSANEILRKKNAELSNVSTFFKSIIADVDVELHLAQLDENGNPTDGITYTNTPLTLSANDGIKNLSRWNPSKYLNVWVVQKPRNGSGGYSYLPGISSDRDGIIVRASQFGTSGLSSNNLLSRITLAHELGHYLGLEHTWGGSNTPLLAINCNDDDRITDTPNTIGDRGGCIRNNVTCSTRDNIENAMNYSSCPSMFTEGQKSRMNFTFDPASGRFNRSVLVSSANITATGTADNYVKRVGKPSPDFYFSPDYNQRCIGNSIFFKSLVYNVSESDVTSYNWSFQNGTPATSNSANPIIKFNTSGTFTVSLTTTTSAGSNTKSKTITIKDLTSGLSALSENFENTNFNNNNDPNLNWILDGRRGLDYTTGFKRIASGSKYNASIFCSIVVPSSNSGTIINSIISPSTDFSKLTSNDKLFFDIASGFSSTATPNIVVYWREKCSSLWRNLKTFNDKSVFKSVDINDGDQYLISSNSEWKTLEVSLTKLLRLSPKSGEIKIELRNNTGTAGFYVDNIRLGSKLGINNLVNNNITLDIYPNPIDNSTVLSLNTINTSSLKVTLFDVVGREIKSEQYNATSQSLTIKNFFTNLDLKKSVYFIKIETERGVTTKKIVR